jgi:hypothetical protein
MWIILIVACIPPIRPLLARLLQKVDSTIRSKSGARDPSVNELHEYGNSKSGGGSKRFWSTVNGTSRSDTESQEDILTFEQAILKTTNIDVERNSAKRVSDVTDPHFPFK